MYTIKVSNSVLAYVPGKWDVTNIVEALLFSGNDSNEGWIYPPGYNTDEHNVIGMYNRGCLTIKVSFDANMRITC